MARITAAQEENADATEISILEEVLRQATEARAGAIADYRRHRDEHGQGAASAIV